MALETKQKHLAVALESVNDLDAIKEILGIIKEIQSTINLIKA